jgi:hypothetical protein
LDHLNQTEFPPEQWPVRRLDLFADLLKAMGANLEYNFDELHIKRAVYLPTAHGQMEDEQREIRAGLRAILGGQRALPVLVLQVPDQDAPDGGS